MTMEARDPSVRRRRMSKALAAIVLGLMALTPAIPVLAEEGREGPWEHFGPPGDSGEYEGQYIRFAFDARSGQVKDYERVDGRKLMAMVDVGTPLHEPKVEGARFAARGNGTLLVIHDNPTALLQVFVNSSTTIRLRLAPFEYEPGDGISSSRVLFLRDRDVRGALIVSQGTLQDGGEVMVANIEAGGLLVFRLRPPGDEVSPGLASSLLSEIARRRFGAEIDLQLRDGRAEWAAMHYRRNMDVRLVRVAPNGMDVEVSDSEARGTVVLFRLSQGLIRLGRQEALRVTLDGSTLSATPTPNGVLNAEDSDTQTASYYPVVVRGHLALLLVYIPHFSVHSLSVGAAPPGAVILDGPSLGVILAGVAIVATAALVIFRRR